MTFGVKGLVKHKETDEKLSCGADLRLRNRGGVEVRLCECVRACARACVRVCMCVCLSFCVAVCLSVCLCG